MHLSKYTVSNRTFSASLEANTKQMQPNKAPNGSAKCIMASMLFWRFCRGIRFWWFEMVNGTFPLRFRISLIKIVWPSPIVYNINCWMQCWFSTADSSRTLYVGFARNATFVHTILYCTSLSTLKDSPFQRLKFWFSHCFLFLAWPNPMIPSVLNPYLSQRCSLRHSFPTLLKLSLVLGSSTICRECSEFFSTTGLFLVPFGYGFLSAHELMAYSPSFGVGHEWVYPRQLCSRCQDPLSRRWYTQTFVFGLLWKRPTSLWRLQILHPVFNEVGLWQLQHEGTLQRFMRLV